MDRAQLGLGVSPDDNAEMIKAILRDTSLHDTQKTWERHAHDSKNPFWNVNKRRDSTQESELYHRDVTRANKIMLPVIDPGVVVRALKRKIFNRKAKNAIKRLEAIRADCLKKGLAPPRWNPPTNPEWRKHITAPLVKYDFKDFKL